MSLSSYALRDLPKVLGNADPMRYTQMLPGVQTKAEYDCGVHIEGCDNTHNFIGIDGAPVYNSGHLLGFFSVFIPTHFESIDLKKTTSSPSDPNRLGGVVDMRGVRQIPASISADVDCGLISSQATLRLPLGKNAGLVVSGRSSYMNLLYSQWLKFDGSEFRYSFYDVNATATFDLKDGRNIALDIYRGADFATLDDEGNMDLDMDWDNTLTALHYNVCHSPDLKASHTAYYSAFSNQMGFDYGAGDFNGGLKSHIRTLGYKAKLSLRSLNVGLDAAWHNILPQSVAARHSDPDTAAAKSLSAAEYSLFASYGRKQNAPLLNHADFRRRYPF